MSVQIEYDKALGPPVAVHPSLCRDPSLEILRSLLGQQWAKSLCFENYGTVLDVRVKRGRHLKHDVIIHELRVARASGMGEFLDVSCYMYCWRAVRYGIHADTGLLIGNSPYSTCP